VTATAGFFYADITTRAFDWLAAGDPRAILLAPALLLVAVLVRALALYAQTQANNIGVQRAMVRLQSALFGSLMGGDFARLQASASGAWLSQFVNDVTLLREASLRVATNLARSTLTILAALAFMFSRDWALALLLLVVYPLAFWPVIRLGERIRRRSREAQEQAADLTAFLSEAFHGARTVKAYSLETRQQARAEAGFRERARLYMSVLRDKARVDPFLEVVGGIAFAGLLAFAGWRAVNGDATAGELVGFITAIAVASPEVRALGTLNSVLNEGLAAATRLYAILDAPPAIRDRPGAVDVDIRGRIDMEGAVFSFGEGAPALCGLTLAAEPGAMIALVGPSGGGKTTALSLLLRLHDPQSGAVRLDGVDVRDMTLASLRRAVAAATQDAFLFDDTVRANIALGRPSATQAELEGAAASAACDFIAELPGGWEFRVGEGGRNLSGGQRQRVALARALLSPAPILLLDEPTSALDAVSEARIQETLRALRGRRTVVVVAHRLATARPADRIYVIDRGRVVQTGAHEQLAAAPGLYADLIARQLL
jgi:subfamily B ATP-binding cassette protein MsbA